jgi:hypothetical protein
MKPGQKVDIKEQIKTIAINAGIDSEKATVVAQKCYDEVYWMPYGGAKSFAEIDEMETAREYASEISDTTYKLRGIIDNITSDNESSTDEKVNAIQSAASEYKSRLSAVEYSDKTLWDKLKSFLKSKTDEPEVVEPEQLSKSFKVFKDKQGKYRWVAFSSNSFEDLERELFSTKALEEAVEYAEKADERGPLLLFHVPEAEIGHCDFQAVQGRFLIESGTFDDTPLGKKALDYFINSDEEHQVSIGYKYVDGDEKDGIYDWFRFRERSVCPHGTAANPWTDFKVTAGGNDVDDRQKGFLSKVLGEEWTNSAIATADQKTKELENQGIRFKTIDGTTEQAVSAEFVRSLAKEMGLDPDRAVAAAKAVASKSESEGEKPAEEAPNGGEVEKPAEPAPNGEESAEEKPDEAIKTALKPFGELVIDMANNLDAISNRLKAIEDDVKAIKAQDAPPVQAVRPSEDTKTLVDKAMEIVNAADKAVAPKDPASPYVDDLLANLSNGRVAANS